MNEEDKIGLVRIIAMRGLPRSGKSTVARRIQDRFGHPIVSRDAIRLALHGSAFIAEREEDVTVAEGIMLRALAYSGHLEIVIDECHANALKSEEVILGYFEDTEFEVEVTFAVIDTPIDECKQRAIDSGQECLVPVISRMEMAWTT